MFERLSLSQRVAMLCTVFCLSFTISTAPGLAEQPPATPTIEILNARTPEPGILVGGQPTPEQLTEAAAAGYRTVVNLRGPGEGDGWDEASAAESLGLTYVTLPIASAKDIGVDNARRLAEVLEVSERPILLHCGSGNRVGALLALKAHHLDGADPETALQIGLDAGLTSLQEVVKQDLFGDAYVPPAAPEAKESDG